MEVYNDKRRGVIIVTWKKDKNAVTTAFEMKEEEGVWQNGLYCEKEKMKLTYPFGTKLSIRSKTIGPNTLKSDYTEPVDVMVS